MAFSVELLLATPERFAIRLSDPDGISDDSLFFHLHLTLGGVKPNLFVNGSRISPSWGAFRFTEPIGPVAHDWVLTVWTKGVLAQRLGTVDIVADGNRVHRTTV